MSILFNEEENKYFELQLISINDPEWLSYNIHCGKINNQKKLELLSLDNEYLYFRNELQRY
ncbi:MAG: hypothetical protein J6I65_01790, partial [Lachnospiraceae bacterium]|nr:hypothetical protein [Lachnospiraceae bacterium]